MRRSLCMLLMTVLATPAVAQTTVIHAGTLLAVPGERPKTEQSIVLNGERISSVANGYIDPATLGNDVTLIDLSDHFVLPGLMDMHVHLDLDFDGVLLADRDNRVHRCGALAERGVP